MKLGPPAGGQHSWPASRGHLRLAPGLRMDAYTYRIHRTYIYIYMCAPLYIYIDTYIYIHIYIFICRCTYCMVHIYVHTEVKPYLCTCTHIMSIDAHIRMVPPLQAPTCYMKLQPARYVYIVPISSYVHPHFHPLAVNISTLQFSPLLHFQPPILHIPHVHTLHWKHGGCECGNGDMWNCGKLEDGNVELCKVGGWKCEMCKCGHVQVWKYVDIIHKTIPLELTTSRKDNMKSLIRVREIGCKRDRNALRVEALTSFLGV